MNKFHFIHGGINYYYNSTLGCIEKEDEYFAPVHADLADTLNSADVDDTLKVSILRAIVLSYNRGYVNGQDDKVRDIRRVLGVNY